MIILWPWGGTWCCHVVVLGVAMGWFLVWPWGGSWCGHGVVLGVCYNTDTVIQYMNRAGHDLFTAAHR